MRWGNKKIRILITILVLSGLFLPMFGNVAYAQTQNNLTTAVLGPGAIAADLIGGSNIEAVVAPFFAAAGDLLIRLSTSILAIVGMGLNSVLDFTLVKMSQNLGKDMLGLAISDAWGTVRDVANLAFIFVLLYAAIKVIFFDLNVKSIGGTIRNIVIVGLLINFSMFFTKVAIDASNIATVGFYNAIMTGAQSTRQSLQINSLGEPEDYTLATGIATEIMAATGIHTYFDKGILEHFKSGKEANKIIFVTTILGSITMLVTAVVFAVVSVMFIARFILLVFMMIISPLALVAYILPKMKGYFDQWKDSVISQAFFAPLFMLLLWVAIKILSSSVFTKMITEKRWVEIGADPKAVIGLIINYSLVMGFIIAALIMSKKMASQAAGFNMVAGAVGTTVLGGGALVGRQTVGRAAGRLEKSQAFQRWAGRSKIGNVLYTGTQKTARASFDTRRLGETAIGKMTGAEKLVGGFGKAGGEGGYEKTREEKTKKMIEKGKQFTDRQARVNYARRIASKLTVIGGSTPNNVNSLFGTMGRSHRMAAATLLDERIKELRADMNAARGELNTLNNNMGFTPNTGVYAGIFVAPAGMIATLTPAEQARYTTLTGPATTNGSVANMSAEMQSLSDPATGMRHTLGLDSTLRQQY